MTSLPDLSKLSLEKPKASLPYDLILRILALAFEDILPLTSLDVFDLSTIPPASHFMDLCARVFLQRVHLHLPASLYAKGSQHVFQSWLLSDPRFTAHIRHVDFHVRGFFEPFDLCDALPSLQSASFSLVAHEKAFDAVRSVVGMFPGLRVQRVKLEKGARLSISSFVDDFLSMFAEAGVEELELCETRLRAADEWDGALAVRVDKLVLDRVSMSDEAAEQLSEIMVDLNTLDARLTGLPDQPVIHPRALRSLRLDLDGHDIQSLVFVYCNALPYLQHLELAHVPKVDLIAWPGRMRSLPSTIESLSFAHMWPFDGDYARMTPYDQQCFDDRLVESLLASKEWLPCLKRLYYASITPGDPGDFSATRVKCLQRGVTFATRIPQAHPDTLGP